MVEKGIKLSNKHGVKYKYIECYLNDMEEINMRLQTRKRLVSQIEKVESEVAFKKWLNGSKRPLNSEYLIVNSSEPLERYAEKMMNYMSR
ncbi:ABC transporter ATP-binding protein [Bacillus sp. UMTAT18]|nr:ABC transporter ATP-binding protein [Bacillus sp. UMTAT18]